MFPSIQRHRSSESNVECKRCRFTLMGWDPQATRTSASSAEKQGDGVSSAGDERRVMQGKCWMLCLEPPRAQSVSAAFRRLG